MPEDKILEEETDFDTATALADISSDLFGQEDEVESGEEGEQESPAKVVETPAAVEEPNAEEVQELGAPKTWSKEALQEWATLPERSKQEILKREEDIFRGIEGYRERAELGDQYNKVVEPFRAALEAENVDPVGLFQSFASNHYILSRGSPAQKLELTANLVESYGIDPTELFERTSGITKVDPAIEELRRQNAELTSRIDTRERSEQTAQFSSIQREVEAFASDPKNTYYSEVANDIAQLLNAGVAITLQDAYEKAVYANPVTRQKEIDRLTSEKLTANSAAEKARVDKVAKLTGANVTSIPKNRDAAIAVGSLDDTLNETLAKIRSQA
jgi:hypothetical protein